MRDRTISRRRILQLAAATGFLQLPLPATAVGSSGGYSADRFARPGTGSMPMVLWFWNGTVTRELVAEGLADLRAKGITEVLLFPFDTGALKPAFFSEEWFDIIGYALSEAERHAMAIWLFNDDFFPSGRAGGFVVGGGTVGGRTYKPRPDLRAKCVVRSTIEAAGGSTVKLDAQALSVAGGRLIVDAMAYDGVRVLKAGGGWDTYHVTAKVRIDKATAGLMFRCADAKNGYLADLRTDGGVDVYRQRDGAFTQLLQGKAKDGFDPQAEHEVAVSVSGDTIGLKLDGAELPQVKDGSFATGTIGVRATATQRSSWSALTVTGQDGAELYAADFDDPGSLDTFQRPGDLDLGKPVAAAARPAGATGGGTIAKMIDLSEAAQGPGEWQAPEGSWQIDLYSPRLLADESGPWRNYLDLLDEEAVRLFLDIVPGEYVRRFGKSASGVLQGFADDEPFLASADAAWGRVPWSPTLPDEIAKLAPEPGPGVILSAVHDDLGDDGRALRGAFWRAVSNRYAATYYRNLGEWTARHGLDVISNPLWDEFGPGEQLRSSGNLNTSHQWVQIPGTDHIFDHYQRGYHRTLPRWAASAAHQRGLDRAYLEALGGAGWQVAPGFAREVIGAFAVRGINKVLLHARFSDSGNVVYPPPMQQQNPWWDKSAPLNRWIGRVVEATRATAAARTALVQPQRAAECLQDSPEMAELDKAFMAAAHALEDVQVDFDFLDEGALDGDPALIEHGRPGRTGLRVGQQEYAIAVLPRTPVLSLGAAETLTEFVSLGGTLVAVGELPEHEPTGAGDRLAKALDRLFAHPRAHRADDPAEAASAVAGAGGAAATLTPATPDVRVLRLRNDDDRSFLVTNEQGKAAEFMAEFPARGVPELWDPDTGRATPAGVWRGTDTATSVRLRLEARATLLVVLKDAARAPAHATEANAPVEQVTADGGTATATVRVARPQTVEVTAVDGERGYRGSRTVDDPLTPVALDGDWSFRFDRDGAGTVSRPLGSWTELDAGHSGSGTYEKRFSLDGGALADRRWQLDLGEVREVAEVTLNGRQLPARLWAPYRLDITEALRAGANTLSVRVTNTGANAHGDAVPSGLLGPVRLRPERLVRVRLTETRGG
ncbi:glycosylhydrolase-like jelly roll fold domain-containing protein [Streptomyces boninensis]|uniref:glycosylhydrolase-like jelly roll fold domain-containing protein n=1 Tax=Streptomyces boninensis TaxID=2039455 RepID=UPI003B212D0A